MVSQTKSPSWCLSKEADLYRNLNLQSYLHMPKNDKPLISAASVKSISCSGVCEEGVVVYFSLIGITSWPLQFMPSLCWQFFTQS